MKDGPRSRRLGTIPSKDLHRLLHGRCDGWPDCICGRKWNEYDKEVFPRWEHSSPTDEQWRAAQLDIACVLHCVRKHCPNKRARQHATIQLLNPILKIGGAE